MNHTYELVTKDVLFISGLSSLVLSGLNCASMGQTRLLKNATIASCALLCADPRTDQFELT
jgi:hypothetical protein